MDIDKCADCLSVYCSFSESDRQKLEMWDEMYKVLIDAHEYNDHWGSENYHRWAKEVQDQIKSILDRAKKIQGRPWNGI